MLSMQAAHGVQVCQGSLLETEIQFEQDVDYSKQLAMYPHEQAGFSAEYKSTLFGFAEQQADRSKYVNAGVAGGSTLATSVARNPEPWKDAYGRVFKSSSS
jgi:hypothetical protein